MKVTLMAGWACIEDSREVKTYLLLAGTPKHVIELGMVVLRRWNLESEYEAYKLDKSLGFFKSVRAAKAAVEKALGVEK